LDRDGSRARSDFGPLDRSVTGTQSKAKASSSAGGKKQSTLQFSQAGKSQASEVVNLDSD
jgi:hypothetical protein